MASKNQTNRLTKQQKKTKGVLGIFGKEAKNHDLAVGEIAQITLEKLKEKYPKLIFRYCDSISKAEINKALSEVDADRSNAVCF